MLWGCVLPHFPYRLCLFERCATFSVGAASFVFLVADAGIQCDLGNLLSFWILSIGRVSALQAQRGHEDILWQRKGSI